MNPEDDATNIPEDSGAAFQLPPPPTKAEVQAETDELIKELRRFRAIPVVANLFTYAFMSNVQKTGYDYPYVEFASLVYWYSADDADDAIVPSGLDIINLNKKLGYLFFSFTRLWSRSAQLESKTPDLDEIGMRIRQAGMGIRVPAYRVHQLRLLHGLFDPFKQDMRSILGFDIDDVVGALDVIPKIYDDARRTFSTSGSFSNQQELDAFFGTLGDYLAFDAAVVAGSSALSVSRTSAVLEAFSLKRGSLDIWALTPSPYSALREQPLLNLASGKYLAPNLDLLLAAILPRLEHTLNPENLDVVAVPGLEALNRRYLTHRGAWVEDEVARILKKLMPGGSGDVGVYYPVNDVMVEGDVVYQVDDVVLLFEEKAGAFNSESLRGAPSSLTKNIKDTITYGHDQATRAAKYISDGGRQFYDKHGQPSLALSGIVREVLPAVVTLASTGIFSAATAQLQRAGLMSGDATWFLSITDLMILEDCLPNPGELRHYMRKRAGSLSDERIIAYDETDYLGLYLFVNDFDPFSDEDEPVDTFAPMFMDTFDDYYVRSASKKPPHQIVPSELRMLIAALAAASRPNWSQAICDLMMFGSASRKGIGDQIARIFRINDGKPHDFTVATPGKFSITVVIDKRAHPVDARERFATGIRLNSSIAPTRLIIGYNPTTCLASAEYYAKAEDRYLRTPPAQFWHSLITNR